VILTKLPYKSAEFLASNSKRVIGVPPLSTLRLKFKIILESVELTKIGVFGFAGT